MIQGSPYGNVSTQHGLEGTLVSGSIYWVASDADYEDEKELDKLILAFDLIHVKFRLVGAPCDDDIEPTWGPTLVEVRGCLGFYQTRYKFRDVEMWILKEDENNNECWTKLVRIPEDFGMYSHQSACSFYDQR